MQTVVFVWTTNTEPSVHFANVQWCAGIPQAVRTWGTHHRWAHSPAGRKNDCVCRWWQTALWYASWTLWGAVAVLHIHVGQDSLSVHLMQVSSNTLEYTSQLRYLLKWSYCPRSCGCVCLKSLLSCFLLCVWVYVCVCVLVHNSYMPVDTSFTRFLTPFKCCSPGQFQHDFVHGRDGHGNSDEGGDKHVCRSSRGAHRRGSYDGQESWYKHVELLRRRP